MPKESPEEIEQLERELADLEEKASGTTDLSSIYGSPTPEKKDNQFKFFKYVIDLPESWKVGNLKEEEIGRSSLSVKSNLELAQYADAEGLDLVGKYFTGQANIIASVSMGRKGFMAQLFVTQIKKDGKINTTDQKKRGFFSGGKTDGE